jgi:hypothetical protein
LIVSRYSLHPIGRRAVATKIDARSAKAVNEAEPARACARTRAAAGIRGIILIGHGGNY